MRLLICTQAVDRTDPVLGFFHRWIEVLAPEFDSVVVTCLRKGDSTLPDTVTVRSLGKEHGKRARIRYAAAFLSVVWKERKRYDTVFVHMNQEYVLLAGLFWRLAGKRVMLWRNHRHGTLATRLACRLAHVVCYTSPRSFTARYPKAVRMPLGIDTDAFTPPARPAPRGRVLFLGRLDTVKRPALFLDALTELVRRRPSIRASLYGSATAPDDPDTSDLLQKAAKLEKTGHLVRHGAVPPHDTPDIFRAHGAYVNLTPSGSFDKTIGEAMASGCLVMASNEALADVVPEDALAGDTAASVAGALNAMLGLGEEERAALTLRYREYVVKEHSLALLVNRLTDILKP